MGIDSLHPDYVKRSKQWKLIRDCVEGHDVIKAAGEEYLPRAEGMSDREYAAYKKRAEWNDFTSKHLESMHGMILRKNVVIECSDEFRSSGLLENIDRKGTNIYQFISDVLYDCMQTSFGGILLDLPPAKPNLTKAQAEEQGIRPYLRYYPAESITNWGYSSIKDIETKCYQVLKEKVEVNNSDEFDHNTEEQYRCLQIKNGKYIQALYTPVSDKKGQNNGFGFKEKPISVNGEAVEYLPFITLPNDTPQKPMYYGTAICNISNYMKSADYENGVHLTTIPTGYVTGHKMAKDPETGEKETIQLGADSFLVFPNPESKVGTLVFSGEGLTHSENALNSNLKNMAIIASRILETSQNSSADAAKFNRVGDNAKLATFAKNVAERFSKILTDLAHWAGYKNEKVTVILNTDYDSIAFDPNALNALANLAEANKLPAPYVFWNLKNGEYAPNEADLEEYATLLQMENAGMSILEQLEYMRAKRSGKKVPLDTKVLNNPPIQIDKPVKDTNNEE